MAPCSQNTRGRGEPRLHQTPEPLFPHRLAATQEPTPQASHSRLEGWTNPSVRLLNTAPDRGAARRHRSRTPRRPVSLRLRRGGRHAVPYGRLGGIPARPPLRSHLGCCALFPGHTTPFVRRIRTGDTARG